MSLSQPPLHGERLRGEIAGEGIFEQESGAEKGVPSWKAAGAKLPGVSWQPGVEQVCRKEYVRGGGFQPGKW